MSKQVIRVKSFWGQQRLEINPQTETFIELKNKIAFNINMNATDISLHPEGERNPELRADNKIKISSIPQLKENGVTIFVKAKPGAQKPQQQTTSNEPPKPLNKTITVDDIINKSKQEKEQFEKEKQNKSKMEIEEMETKQRLSRCTHGPGGKCVNCIVIETCKDKLKQDMKQHCQHGPNGKCVNCLGSEFIASAKHKSFDQFWSERILKCKNTHLPSEKCPHCTPLENMVYKVKLDCKNHQPFPKSMCAHCLPPSITLVRQPYRHVDFASIMNVKEIGGLVQNWTKQDFQEQKFGWLYGYYAEDPNYPLGIRAVIEAVYEPLQIGDISGHQLLEDPYKENVDRIASALGFELIGQIYTSINHDLPMSQHEIRQAAKYQNQYRVNHQTGYVVSKFITCILRTGKQNPSDVAPEVYMVSDQAVDLERDNIFTESDSRKALKIRESTSEIDIIPTVMAEQKPGKEFDPSWFIVNVGVGNMPDIKYNILQHHDFPVSNRQEKEQTPQFVKKFLSRFKNQPSEVRFADFHLLIYLSKLIDIETALAIAEYVGQGKPIPHQTVEFIEHMLQNY